MNAMLLLALSTWAAVPTRTTPVEILRTCYFNDARADATLLHHVVEVASRVSTIERDGMGGYVAQLDGALESAVLTARVRVSCHFPAGARDDLAGIRPGDLVTIRGVVRRIDDRLHWYVDQRVAVAMKDCELIAGAE